MEMRFPKKEWYIMPEEESAAHGPYSKSELKTLYYSGEVGTEALVWRKGRDEWLPYRSCFGVASAISAAVRLLTGLRGMGNMNFKRFFSQVLKRHTLAQVRESVAARHCETPQFSDGTWPSPWVYTRVLLWGVLLAVLGYAYSLFTHEAALSIPLISIVAPLATYVLFAELNVRRDLPFMKTLLWTLLAGILTCFFAGVANVFIARLLNAHEQGILPQLAGLTEEPLKLLTALLIARMMGLRCNRILRGMMLGCAVGMAFAFWETIQYLDNALNSSNMNMLWTGIMRACHEPFAHTVWTAITTGAFCLAQREEEKRLGAKDEVVRWRVLFRWRYLRIAILPVILHCCHNSCFDLFSVIPATFIEFMTCLLAWELALSMVKAGLRQTRGQAIGLPAPPPPSLFPGLFSFSFRGRMQPQRYLLLVALLLAAGIALNIIFSTVSKESEHYMALLLAAYVIAAPWVFTAATVRRLRDAGLSVYWALLFVPLTLTIIFALPVIIVSVVCKSVPLSEEELLQTQKNADDTPQSLPAQPRLVPPGPHESGICCPHCNGYGAHTPLHPCTECCGTGMAPLLAAITLPETRHESFSVLRALKAWFIPSFKGRLTRGGYLLSLLILVAIATLAGGTDNVLLILLIVWQTLVFISASVRRLHDVGLKGWWALLLPASAVLLLVPWVTLFFLDSRPGSNPWGACPKI